MIFYEIGNGHGLPHNPLKAIIAPRPIGWIGTRSRNGCVNLAPYSFFNMIADTPPLVMFSSSGKKDSVSFIEETGVFTVSAVGDRLKQQMNISSIDAPRGTSEFEYSGLATAPGQLVEAPFVKEAYAALECEAVEIKQLRDRSDNLSENYMVIGEVVAVHLDENILTNGLVDIKKARPVSRLGYMDYATTEEVYQMFRPKWPKDL